MYLVFNYGIDYYVDRGVKGVVAAEGVVAVLINA